VIELSAQMIKDTTGFQITYRPRYLASIPGLALLSLPTTVGQLDLQINALPLRTDWLDRHRTDVLSQKS
jgi:hypothetical protein